MLGGETVKFRSTFRCLKDINQGFPSLGTHHPEELRLHKHVGTARVTSDVAEAGATKGWLV